MFYLAHFYQILFQTPLKSSLFVFLSCTLIIGFSYQTVLKHKIFKIEPKSGHYFYALISSKKNHLQSARKLRQLPGVGQVLSVSTETIKKETQKILAKTYPELALDQDSDWEKMLSALPYRGLKVVFSPNLREHSQTLIKDYLVKLVGKDAITLGATKYNKELLTKKKSAVRLLQNWGVLLGLIIISLFWLMIGISLLTTINKSSYLIENFQRRYHVAIKTSFSGMASLFFLGLLFSKIFSLTGASVSFGQALWALIPFSILALFCSRSHEWSS